MERKIQVKAVVLVLALALLASAFMAIRSVKAWPGTYVDVEAYSTMNGYSMSEFSRAWSNQYGSQGIADPDHGDLAFVWTGVEFGAGSGSWFWMHCELYRRVGVSDYCSGNFGWSDWIDIYTIKAQFEWHSGWDTSEAYHYDGLKMNQLSYGEVEVPDDWKDHRIIVQYKAVWIIGTSEYDEDVSNTLTHCEAQNDPHPNDPWFQCPDEAGGVGCEVVWEETWGNAEIVDAGAIVGYQDEDYATLDAIGDGSIARVCLDTTYLDNGLNVKIRLGGVSANALVLVYVQEMGTDWRFWGSQNIMEGNPYWLDFGYADFDSYFYVLIVAYNIGARSTVSVDCYECGQY